MLNIPEIVEDETGTPYSLKMNREFLLFVELSYFTINQGFNKSSLL